MNADRSKAGIRRQYIGGSDARVIMAGDEAALQRLWREKRGELQPQDHSGNLLVQLGLATEVRAHDGAGRQRCPKLGGHPVIRWMAATLDGIVEGSGAVFEAKFMLPWSFSEEAAAEKHMAQLQHNMWVTGASLIMAEQMTAGAIKDFMTKVIRIVAPVVCARTPGRPAVR